MDHSDASIPVEATYRELRRMAAADPRAARARLLELLNFDKTTLDRFFDFMMPASEGRLRQLVANTAKAHLNDTTIRDYLIPCLIKWQRVESDEFAKSAITGALQGIDLAAFSNFGSSNAISTSPETPNAREVFSEEFVDIFRWVAGRLCHRVRNRMELPIAYLVDAIHEAMSIEDDVTRTVITTRLRETQEAFKQVARIVEFNIDDSHFQWKTVAIVPWLRKMTDRYRSSNRPFQLNFEYDASDSSFTVEATDLLLEVIFWNLWQNISQEITGLCVVTVTVSHRDGMLCLLITDNGPGFQSAHAADAFKTSLSTRGVERGRGLLEVADAAQRLRGFAQLVNVSGDYRVELSFPIAKSLRNE